MDACVQHLWLAIGAVISSCVKSARCHNLPRIRIMYKYPNALLPGGILWERKAEKLTNGFTRMALQGYPVSRYNTSVVSNRLANQLSGNMLNGYVSLLMILAFLSTVPLPSSS